jgi:predicted MFS family arabinose efflux permease
MAGLLTGAASFVTITGSVVAAWQARAGRDNRLSMAISILLPALLLFFVFRDLPDLTQVATLVIVLNAVSGIFPGLAFAMLPRVAATDAEMAAANGLFTQFGASGSLIGPPLLASCAAWWGWSGAAAAGALASAVCFVLIMQATTAAAPRRDLAEFRP